MAEREIWIKIRKSIVFQTKQFPIWNVWQNNARPIWDWLTPEEKEVIVAMEW